MALLESKFKKDLKNELFVMFPGCRFLNNDAGYIQGIPDLTILWQRNWALLETKRGLNAKKQPNQDWYVESFNEMSFAAFINPENRREVLDALQRSFTNRR